MGSIKTSSRTKIRGEFNAFTPYVLWGVLLYALMIIVLHFRHHHYSELAQLADVNGTVFLRVNCLQSKRVASLLYIMVAHINLC